MVQGIPAQALYSAEDAERGIMQLLLDALPTGALLIDPDGGIVALNQQAESVLGWAAPALAGKPAHEVLNCYRSEERRVGKECRL